MPVFGHTLEFIFIIESPNEFENKLSEVITVYLGYNNRIISI